MNSMLCETEYNLVQYPLSCISLKKYIDRYSVSLSLTPIYSFHIFCYLHFGRVFNSFWLQKYLCRTRFVSALALRVLSSDILMVFVLGWDLWSMFNSSLYILAHHLPSGWLIRATPFLPCGKAVIVLDKFFT